LSSSNSSSNKHRETTLIYVLKAALKTCLRAVIVLENKDRIGGVVEMDRETVRESSFSRLFPIEKKIQRSTTYRFAASWQKVNWKTSLK